MSAQDAAASALDWVMLPPTGEEKGAIFMPVRQTGAAMTYML